jgi:hypothetical protein
MNRRFVQVQFIAMLILIVSVVDSGALFADSIAERFQKTRRIIYLKDGVRVDSTIAVALKSTLAINATINALQSTPQSMNRSFTIAVFGEGLAAGPESPPADSEWMYIQLKQDGSGVLMASRKHLMYGLFALLRDGALNVGTEEMSRGHIIATPFKVVIGDDGFYGRRRRFCRNYDAEMAIEELARLGCSHVVANALAMPYPVEQGPPGEIYYRFYQFAPDLDMYVETRLNRGTYPPEVLNSNLEFLRKQARLADAYGLTPGVYMANPRSMPESFWERYPWLRGARVDHTFRSFRPRYNMSVAHPLVRWHYAEMLKKLLQKVPELGFVATLINDSGSGFEYTASLYPGRNGGPYLVREWRPDSLIARKAAENIIRYYQTLKNAARETHPEFRIITGLKNIAEEADIILSGFEKGIDLFSRTQRHDAPSQRRRKADLESRGSAIFTNTSAAGSRYIKGIPSPWRTAENLISQLEQESRHLEIRVDPISLVPRDINREVLRRIQLGGVQKIDTCIANIAEQWAGSLFGKELLKIWKLTDRVARVAPALGLYEASGFTWYRLWDRPLVPDIGKIPAAKRAYYEDYMLAVFNNPNRVDLQADALWTLYPTEQCDRFLAIYDNEVLPLLDSAIVHTGDVVASLDKGHQSAPLFLDLRDRLHAFRCYLTTLRNVCAWISGVHGYLDATTAEDRSVKMRLIREMISLEIRNTEALLRLWQESEIDFMPVYRFGENGHDYGPNFGECLEKKIALMREYGNEMPCIDPNFIWRLPENSGLDISPEEYLP